MPYAKPYSAACAGRAPRQAHSSGTTATNTTGPSPTGGKHRPVRTPATSAAPSRVQLGLARGAAGVRCDTGAAGVTRSGAVVAVLPCRIGEAAERQQQEARLAQELVGASGHDPRRAVGPVVTVAFLLLDLLLVVLERGARGPLLEQRVEGCLDVVGVELLVEVDHALLVVLVLGRGRGGGLVGDHGNRHLGVRVVDLLVEQRDVVALLVEGYVVLELVLFEVVVRLGF